MKYIFDFDDVIFQTTPRFKELLENVRSEKDAAKQAVLYEELMKRSAEFVNPEMLAVIKKIGKENCYLVTYGDQDFQGEKIRRAGVSDLFSQIFIVQTGKKNAVENICAKYPDEKIFFIDDKASHFADLDLEKYPNLKTILYTGQTKNELLKEISS